MTSWETGIVWTFVVIFGCFGLGGLLVLWLERERDLDWPDRARDADDPRSNEGQSTYVEPERPALRQGQPRRAILRRYLLPDDL